mmetsp:Transcript_1632/g.3430  ORF Transcript_1632/g.3430 Transcript_1632/m.3430 type:complete len:321 (-) Transcript_1632:1580-2542(-)
MMEVMSIQHHTTSNSNPVRRMDEPFPLKLHRLLEDVQNTPQSEILAWDPDGRSFTIFQPKGFAESIMGQYFRQTKYKSFQRQMNLYGFVREVRGKIRGVYSHPQFIRHDRDLCLQIKRSNKAPTRSSFGSSSSSSNNSIRKTGVANSTAAAASIDVSSPLFAPLNTTLTQISSTTGGANNNNSAFNLGLALATEAKLTLPTTTTRPTTTTLHQQLHNNFSPSFTLPAGGLPSFSSAKQISLDDEESMGTIDELPTTAASTTTSTTTTTTTNDNLSSLYLRQQQLQQLQQQSQFLFAAAAVAGEGETTTTTTSDDFAAVAV